MGFFLDKNTGVGCHFFLWGIFLTQDQTSPASAGRFLSTVPPGRPALQHSPWVTQWPQGAQLAPGLLLPSTPVHPAWDPSQATFSCHSESLQGPVHTHILIHLLLAARAHLRPRLTPSHPSSPS